MNTWKSENLWRLHTLPVLFDRLRKDRVKENYMDEVLGKLKAFEEKPGCKIDVEIETDIEELSPEQLSKRVNAAGMQMY